MGRSASGEFFGTYHLLDEIGHGGAGDVYRARHIHPAYADATIVCSCGNTVQTRSTKADLHVEICSNCHPFYTGKQKFVDTGGRLGRFQARLHAFDRT